MKETIKVSIGGYAFTLDRDAYEVLNVYLDKIKLHFETKDDGGEIVADIEYRMCELLQMKSNSVDYIVNKDDVHNIIEMMGNPTDFDDDNLVNDQVIEEDKQTIQKRLYRDVDNSLIGGVCSGLSRYFNLDPVLIRIIFLTVLVTSSYITGKIGGLMVLAYVLLWIITPAAKTIKQKIAMSGNNPTIESIESGTSKIKRKSNSNLGVILSKILRFCCFVPIFLVGSWMVIAIMAFFGITYILGIPTLNDLLITLGIPSSTSMHLLILCIIPACMLIYFSIRFIIGFKKKDLIIGSIAFVIWLIPFVIVTKIGFDQANMYKGRAVTSDIAKIEINSDTLHIGLADLYKSAEPFTSNVPLYLIDRKPISWFVLPTITIDKDSSYKTIDVEIKTIVLDKNTNIAEDKAKNTSLKYTIKDSQMIIEPQVYSAKNIWNRQIFEIIIHCPIDKKIVYEKPIKRWLDPIEMKYASYVFEYNSNSEY